MSVLVVRGRRRTGLLALAFGLAVLAMAACSSSEDPTVTSTPPTAPATTTPIAPAATDVPSATQAPSAATQVPTAAQPASDSASEPVAEESGEVVDAVSVGDFGEILIGPDGLTLYTFDLDTKGVSNCSGGCLGAWPPFLSDGAPSAGAGVTADIGTITLDDGSTQVTIDGFPAYYWAGDSSVGDAGGHGVNNAWWVVTAHGLPQRPAKVATSENPELGTILVDGSGLAIYIYDEDVEGVSNCTGACASAWPPVLAQYGTVVLGNVTAELGTITRDDGTTQMTVNGFPAYYWAGDSSAGDAGGHGVGGVWWAFNADGSPQRPASEPVASDPVADVAVTKNSKLGTILVGESGRTLYVFDSDTAGVSNCSGGCLFVWPPLLVDEVPNLGSDVTAAIGTITRGDGTTQVTVNGFPAYYYVGDSSEGDVGGQGVDGAWWVFDPDGTPQRPGNTAVSNSEDEYNY